jgi:Zn-dependent protease
LTKLEEWDWRFRNLNEVESFLLAIFSIAVKAIPLYFLLPSYSVLVIPAVILAATIAVIPHELAHRQYARKYGCFSRFTLNFTGFLLTTIINILPFFGLFFLSGYTAISCRFFSVNKEIEGKSAAVGPLTNIVISVLSFLLIGYVPSIVAFFLYEIAAFNAVVAFFNLLPFWILDGLKVFRWNIGIWIVMIAISVILMYFTGEL